ncbi:helix-turn-helix transcriptional regulator [Nesterenkonia jeotgali]|uniref:Transcriptional regulator with XRE-family HTH domain n=1 Tax=Nesterenkonia jeotgali TaxID=317018 RepID=A0A839FTJ7_9MICC|nr:helix-turn-helix transcriptional regulator [Nesterenkonia jeotgali]MBA8920414.1 transcriptional regulator with XRE-family HTH domain [Nesterenkonia jeotgali]
MTNDDRGHVPTPEENFCVNMKLLRESKGWSQADLAEALRPLGLDLHRQTIQKIESLIRPVKLNEAHAIAQALGDHVDEMVSSPALRFMSDELTDLDDKIVTAQKALEEVYSAQRQIAFLMDANGHEPSEGDLELLTTSHENIQETVAMRFRHQRRTYASMLAELPEDERAGLRATRDLQTMGPIGRRVIEKQVELGLQGPDE